MLESGLSADVELRERKGGWLVRNWSRVAVSRVLAMALYDGINTRMTELVGNGNYDKGKVFSRTVPILNKHLDVETQRDNTCQLSTVSS